MRIVRNIGHVKRRKRSAKFSAIIGFLLLAGTFVIFFDPRLVPLAYGMMLIGFLTFNIGMQQVGKWTHNSRKSRDDFAIDGKLTSLSDRYVLLHFMKVGKEIVEHMLIHPGGILVLTSRDLPGRVEGSGSRWKKKGAGLSRIFGMSGPQLGNPSFDTTRAIQALDRRLEAESLQIETAGVIVFTSPMIELDADESDYPAIVLNELPGLVADLEPDSSFTTADRDRVVALLTNDDEIERQEPTRSNRRPVVKKRAPATKSAE